MNATANRLKRLEKPNAFLLRLQLLYERYIRIEDRSQELAEYWHSLSEVEKIGVVKLRFIHLEKANGTEWTRAEIRRTLNIPAVWRDWFLDGNMEQSVLRDFVEGRGPNPHSKGVCEN